MKVLVVDDDILYLESISALLEHQFEVEVAESVDQAFDLFTHQKIDLVISDYSMPGDNGIELCRKVKGHMGHRYVPFVLMTGSSDPDCEMEAFQAGADDFLQKPTRSQVLLAKCKLMTQLKKLNEDLRAINKNLEQKVQQQVKELEKINQLKRYFSAEKIERIIKSNNIDHFGETFEKDEVSVLFCDIRNFSMISEDLHPQQIKDFLDEYVHRSTEHIFANKGYVDKFLGDGILAVFQSVDLGQSHFKNAVLAAQGIQSEIESIRMKIPDSFKDKFKIGFGINSGTVFMGNVGVGDFFDYTVIGSCVNLSARFQAFSDDNNIVTSYQLAEKWQSDLKIMNRRFKKIKGFKEPLELCDLAIMK